MCATTPFKRLILRAVLRDVYPMVIRLVAVPDCLEVADFDDVFHAVLGWDGGTGYAFQVQGQEFNSFRRQTRSKKLSDFRLHRQGKFLYTIGAINQWEWELRLVDLQRVVEGDQTPVCLGGRGATPPEHSGGATGYGLMLKRQELGEKMFPPAEVQNPDRHPDCGRAWSASQYLASIAERAGRRVTEPGPPPRTVWAAAAGALQLARS